MSAATSSGGGHRAAVYGASRSRCSRAGAVVGGGAVGAGRITNGVLARLHQAVVLARQPLDLGVALQPLRLRARALRSPTASTSSCARALLVSARWSRNVRVGYTNANSRPTSTTRTSASAHRRPSPRAPRRLRLRLRRAASPARRARRAASRAAQPPRATGARRQRRRAEVRGHRAELLLDAQQLVVLRDAVAARRRAGLDLPAVRGDREVGDRRVLGLAAAVRHHRGVAVRAGRAASCRASPRACRSGSP